MQTILESQGSPASKFTRKTQKVQTKILTYASVKEFSFPMFNNRNPLKIDYFTFRICMDFLYKISKGKYGERKPITGSKQNLPKFFKF